MGEVTDNKDKQQEEGKESSSGNKLLNTSVKVIIAGLIVMAILTVAIGYFLTHRPLKPEINEEEQKAVFTFELGPLYSLEPFVVNLIDFNGRRYLKASIDLELENEKMKKDIDKIVPFIRNVIINILSSKTFKDISSVEGKDLLRQEIVFRINRALTTGKVKNVYFKEFVVQ